MNQLQQVWWIQTRSDFKILILLLEQGAEPCHILHYLQMTTEKLAKSYLWQNINQPPPRIHAALVNFLKAIVSRRDRDRVARLLGFKSVEEFKSWTAAVIPLAREVELLAPALAGDGPNTEYPWPRDTPRFAPAAYKFPAWKQLQQHWTGRRLLHMIRKAVERFDEFA